MVRVITQETYDEVVKENIEDLDMTPQEAIDEAIAQFEAQGVDLSNIIKDLALGSGDDHSVTKIVLELQELAKKDSLDEDTIILKLQMLKAECDKDIAHRMKAAKDGIYRTLIKLLQSKMDVYKSSKTDKDAKFILALLQSLVALMDRQPDLLDNDGIDLIKSILDIVANEEILMATLRWISVCCIKHEMNRQRIFAKDIISNTKELLKKQKNRKLIQEVLQMIRKFALDDDIRVEFGKAHEHAREFGLQTLETLADLLKDNTKSPLISELMATIAVLLVRNELCASVSGSVDTLMAILTDNYDNVAAVTQAYKLITALAGNDDVKRKLVNSGMAPVVVSLMNRHASNAATTALSLKCTAALSLREPAHSKEFLECGAPEAIVNCMNMHPDNANVQKNACWAIRNMVARCREYNCKFHVLGVEEALNRANTKFGKQFGYDIRSALRDLDCQVALEEQWTGKGVEISQ